MYNIYYILLCILYIFRLDEPKLLRDRTMEMSSHFIAAFSIGHFLIVRMSSEANIPNFAQVKGH